jgi:hypothetical protein
MVLSIGHVMLFISCRVEKIDDGTDVRMPTVGVRPDKLPVYPPNARAVLHDPEGDKLLMAGTPGLP